MILIPVLHLKDGQAIYSDAKGVINHINPLELTERWFSSGVEWIQINDLNISATTHSANEEAVKKIAQSKLKVQVFGNFKSINVIEKYLELGVQKIILGSIAYQNLELVKEAAQKNPGKIGITIDVKDSKVTIPGYIVASNKTAMDYANRFRDVGVSIFAYSNMDANGNTSTAQIEEIRKFCMECHIPTICTNQINTQAELGDLLKLETYGVIGIILDKAIYENKIDLASAVTFINDQTLSGNDEPTLIPD